MAKRLPAMYKTYGNLHFYTFRSFFNKKAQNLTFHAKIAGRGELSNLFFPDLREVLMFSIVA